MGDIVKGLCKCDGRCHKEENRKGVEGKQNNVVLEYTHHKSSLINFARMTVTIKIQYTKYGEITIVKITTCALAT